MFRPARGLPSDAMAVRDWHDGVDIDGAVMVRAVETRCKRDGGEYLRLQLGDRTGSVVAMLWDLDDELRDFCQAGRVLRVRGRFEVHPRYGRQVRLTALR